MANAILRFNQFLTNDLEETLTQAFPDNAQSLFRGVNYRYQDKVWNIRIAFDFAEGTDNVSRIFLRIHNDSSIYIYSVHSTTHIAGIPVCNRYPVDHIIGITQYICSGQRRGHGNVGPDPDSHPGYFKTDPFPGKLVEILTHGQHDSSAITPKAPQSYVEYIEEKGGFASHPQLRPDTYVLPPQSPRHSEPSHPESIILKSVGTCCVIALLVLFAVYQVSKIIHKYRSQES